VVVVMLMLLLVSSFTTAAGLLTNQNYTNTAWKERNLEARFAYRAGLSTAMANLTANPAWAPTEASPLVDYLDDSERVGFKVWLDGINANSSTPVISASGLALQRGQAALRVVSLVNGKEISSGFGGAETTPIITRPTTVFNHNLLQPDPGRTLSLSTGPSAFLSFNSAAGILPWDSLPALPPSDNQNASVRAFNHIDLAQTTVYGQAILPTSSTLSVGGGGVNGELRDDDGFLPLKYAPPEGAGLSTPPTSGAIAPGLYSALTTPNGANITLERGGVYFFSDIFVGQDNVWNLSGPPSDGPCVIYTHTFWLDDDTSVNLPAPGVPPQPGELQVYGTPMDGCDIPSVILRSGVRAAFVTAGNNMKLEMESNSKLYGAVIASEVTLAPSIEIHYDEALLGVIQEGESEWVMVNQGMR
jgi:hypothetical protein